MESEFLLNEDCQLLYEFLHYQCVPIFLIFIVTYESNILQLYSKKSEIIRSKIVNDFDIFLKNIIIYYNF